MNAINKPQFSGINQLTFYQSKYNKKFVGNGFLIRYQNKVYAVTVKHSLLEAKTPELKQVAISEHISQWVIHPNQKPESAVILGRLVNADEKEAIDMKVLSKDWLVFEVKSNHSNLQPLTLRQSPLIEGERLTAYGCSYMNKNHCRQDEYAGTYLSRNSDNLRIAMPQLELNKLRRLSGSPVLDKNNQVVGIVSNVLRSKSGEGFDFAPATLNYLYEVLATIN